MRMPWKRSQEVEDAVRKSAEELERTLEWQREQEPDLSKVRAAHATNHFEESVLAIMRAAVNSQ